MRKLIVWFFIILLVGSCTHTEPVKVIEKPRVFPQYNAALDEILKTQDGVIRGINLNSCADSVKEKEGHQPVESDKNRLYFEYKIDSLTNYSIEYTLNNDSLEEVNLQINSNDLDVSSKIYTDLKDYYEKKLPNPVEDQGQVVYNCFEGQRRPFVVSLSDNSTPAKGIINLVIYKDK